MGWIMGNQSRPQGGDGGDERERNARRQVGKDGRVKGLSGIMEQQHLSTSGSRGGRRGRRDGPKEAGHRSTGERTKVEGRLLCQPGGTNWVLISVRTWTFKRAEKQNGSNASKQC